MRATDIGRNDLPQLAQLLETLTGRVTPLPRLAAAFDRMDRHPDYHLVGVHDGERLAAAVCGIICLDCVGACQPYLVVENLIVAEAYRRRGLGRLLLAELEARARQRDCFYVMLVSGAARVEARAFYLALGYTAAAGFKKRL